MVSMPPLRFSWGSFRVCQVRTMVSMPRPPSRRHVSSAWHWFAIHSQIRGDQVN
jgi:hypothetical protein